MIGLSTAVKIAHTFDQKGPVQNDSAKAITVTITVIAAYIHTFRYF